MYTEFNEELEKQLTETLSKGVTEDAMKSVKKNVDSIVDTIYSNIEYNLKDELAPMLAGHVKNMAEQSIAALLDGNEKLMRQYLSCSEYGYNGRSDGYGTRNIEDQFPIIHGKVHAANCVELRQRIVEAHADLLKNERILDLEDQVKSLTAQVNKANAEKDSMWERFRHLAA